MSALFQKFAFTTYKIEFKNSTSKNEKTWKSTWYNMCAVNYILDIEENNDLFKPLKTSIQRENEKLL